MWNPNIKFPHAAQSIVFVIIRNRVVNSKWISGSPRSFISWMRENLFFIDLYHCLFELKPVPYLCVGYEGENFLTTWRSEKLKKKSINWFACRGGEFAAVWKWRSENVHAHFSPSILWEPAMELCSPGLKATAVTCRLSSSEMRALVSGCFGLNKLVWNHVFKYFDRVRSLSQERFLLFAEYHWSLWKRSSLGRCIGWLSGLFKARNWCPRRGNYGACIVPAATGPQWSCSYHSELTVYHELIINLKRQINECLLVCYLVIFNSY